MDYRLLSKSHYTTKMAHNEKKSKKRGYRAYSRFKPDQGPMEARKSFGSVSRREDGIVRKLHVAYKNSNPGEPAHMYIWERIHYSRTIS